MSYKSTLASIAAQSRNLTSHLDTEELPQLNLGLDQIEEQSRKLAARGKRSDYRAEGEEGRAAHLLAGGGLNLNDLTDRVQRATDLSALGGTFEPLIPLGDGDVDGYLRHSREQLIITALSESHSQLTNSFYSTLDARLQSSWDTQKRKILEEVGAGDVYAPSSSTAGSSGLGQSAFGRSVRGRMGESSLGASTSSAGQGGQPLPGQTLSSHHRMVKYDSVVRQLNAHRSSPSSPTYPLLKAYSSSLAANANPAIAGSSNQTSSLLVQTFGLLAALVKEGEAGVGERCHANGHLTEGGEAALLVRKGVVQGGKKYLEEQFELFVDRKVAAQPAQAALGGIPSVTNKIKGYVRVAHLKESRWTNDIEILNAEPVWAQLYYLIRSGHPNEAYQLAVANEAAIGATEKYLLSFFKAWLDSPDHRLPHREHFMTEYNQRIRHSSASADGGNSGDPFKHALYRLLGRIDMRKNVSVARTTEDWLWLQLSFVREDVTEGSAPAGDRYGVREMARLVSKFGEGHFDPRGDRPLFWFQVLLFVGEFEKAVASLYSKTQHQVDAVAFAVALSYYGLLRVPAKSEASDVELLTTVTSNAGYQTSYLNLGRLLARYIKPFAKTDPLSALQYIYLVCLPADSPAPTGQQQVDLCHEMIRDLVLESKRYAELLGDVRTDGTKVPGAIARDIKLAHIPDERSYLLSIVKAAASRFSGQQRLTDAIILYNLAEDYDTVVSVLNRALGASLSQPHATSAGKPRSVGFGGDEDLGAQAGEILGHYRQDPSKWEMVSARNRETCRVLLTLKESLLAYEQGRLERTLEVIESIAFLPLSSDISAINRRADEFKDLDEPIAQNFSDVLIVTMNCLFKLHQTLKESSYGGEARQAKMAEYRKKARSLMMFAGMLRYRMSQEVYQQLTRLDAFF